MEVCGTHTMAIARTGLRSVLPPTVRLVSGPGCPVCVTPIGFIDHALALAELPGVNVATFGDLMRVPGSRHSRRDPRSLLSARARGASVHVVYSPRDAVALAEARPSEQVVFLSVGFETTTPGIAAAVLDARRRGLENFSVLCANKTIPEAVHALATAPEIGLDGLLCPGHVSVILGPEVYEPIVERDRLPCAIAGFEAAEILRGLASLVDQIREGRPRVANCYGGAVRPGGNPKARATMAEVFEPCDSEWRGLGSIPGSGLRVRDELAKFDAARRFDVALPPPVEPKGCRCGDVLRGLIEPAECPLFARTCTPEAPVGACMVSSEGSCAASYTYERESSS